MGFFVGERFSIAIQNRIKNLTEKTLLLLWNPGDSSVFLVIILRFDSAMEESEMLIR